MSYLLHKLEFLDLRKYTYGLFVKRSLDALFVFISQFYDLHDIPHSMQYAGIVKS